MRKNINILKYQAVRYAHIPVLCYQKTCTLVNHKSRIAHRKNMYK